MATNIEDLLEAVKQLPPDELSEFTARLVEWQVSSSLPGEGESLLIQQAKRGMSPHAAHRLHELAGKSEQGNLAPAELDEYRQLAQRAERLNAARVEALAELARRRNLPIQEVMKQVGWHEEPHGA